MAIAYGGRAGSNHANTNGAVETVTTTVSIPAGSLIVVSAAGANVGDTSNLTSVTDSAGNTYTSAAFTCDAGQNSLVAVWICPNCAALASGGTVTVTFHTALLASGESWEITVDYITGAATASVTDGSNAKNGQTTAAWNTGTLTTTNANDLVWVAATTNQGGNIAITNAASTPASGWTTLAIIKGGAGNNNQLESAYQVFAATGTYQGGGTATANNNGTSAVIVAFKAASGGGGTAHNGSATLGGQGNLSATGLRKISASSALQGQGNLTASGLRTIHASATLSGQGNLTGSGLRTIQSGASLAGQGNLAVTGSRITQDSATLQGQGNLTVTAVVTKGGATATLQGQANLTVTGFRTIQASAVLSGSGSLIAISNRTIQASATLEGEGSLSATAGSPAIVGNLKSTLVLAPLPILSTLSVNPPTILSNLVLNDAPLKGTLT